MTMTNPQSGRNIGSISQQCQCSLAAFAETSTLARQLPFSEFAASCPHQILFILLAPLSSSAITVVAPSLFAPSFRFLPRMLIICRSSRARRALTRRCGPRQLLPHPRALTVGLNSLHFHYDLSEPSYITKSHTTRMRYYTAG